MDVIKETWCGSVTDRHGLNLGARLKVPSR